jgi:hypothetical protein
MSGSQLAHLELLAEVDSLVERLNRWADEAPAWEPAGRCRSLVRRLTERTASLRVRIEAPLVVAVFGGTGTGKSALVCALVGAEVVRTGRSRPTTIRPTLVCRPGLGPEMLGSDPASVECVPCDLPALRDLVLIDCPDPDTTEEEERGQGSGVRGQGSEVRGQGSGVRGQGEDSTYESESLAVPALASDSPLSPLPSPLSSNLDRLRAILPHCDVLLVTATQQKYRSARVAGELAAAARGAHLVFVQTHADLEADIRDDWRRVLGEENLVSGQWSAASGQEAEVSGQGSGAACGAMSSVPSSFIFHPSSFSSNPQSLIPAIVPSPRIFRVDSLRALADARAGLQPRGDFAELLDLLTRQMAGAAANRIRRANFLDLLADTLDACRTRLDEALPKVRETQLAIDQQRGLLARQLAETMRTELLANRRQWENRLLGQAASRWGLSPFALVLRVYQGLGALVAGALLFRVRTPAQVALWGALQGARSWKWRREKHQADRGFDRAAAAGWDTAALGKAVIIVDGYAAEAGLDRRPVQADVIAAESEAAAAGFVAHVSADLDGLIARLAKRHTGWFTRFRYELLLLAMLGLLLYRLGKNFFYDSWLAEHPTPVHGLDFYVSAGFWLVLWCLVLLWSFCSRLRRGLRGAITELATGWQQSASAAGLFAHIETDCRRAERYRQDLDVLRQEVASLHQQLAQSAEVRSPLPPGEG